ncbi:ornithine carbamoyltransferase [Streptomyces sp. TLI_235]|nr:ornithine carbamoyltransferase [Streptomyces sp. TLI_235]PBC75548.1 ornithine carbamoyltransferase [Streptomyces sp. TLI_235]
MAPTPSRPERRDLLSLRDLTDDQVRHLVRRGVDFAEGRPADPAVADAIVGIYFRKTSTRTRTSFSAAALRLGAKTIAYGPADLQENTGETPEDTALVLSGMLDCLVARTAGSDRELRVLAAHPEMGVINAMSETEHPTQGLADCTMMARRFGRMDGLRVLYAGEGNSTATALALSASRFPGVRLELRTPPGYGVDPDILAESQAHAKRNGGEVLERHDMADLPERLDAVYTARWQTTGSSKADPDWRTGFEPFRVDAAVLAATGATVFMHDLPAHRGEEVTAEVLDGPRSIAFPQAHNKLFGAMAALEWSLGGGGDA